MTSRSLSFKLVRDEARRNLWAVILSVVGFFFVIPLPVIMLIQQRAEQTARWNDGISLLERLSDELPYMMAWMNPLPRFGLMLMGVLCGIALFRYLHDRKQVDFYHALPLKRGQLFAVKYIAGIVLVIPAYLLMRLIAAAVVAAMGYIGLVDGGLFLSCIAVDLLAFFTVYSITVLCAILTGNTIIAVVLDGWALFSLSAVWMVFHIFASNYYATYYLISNEEPFYYSPVLYFGAMGEGDPVMQYVVIAAAALALSAALFRIRRSERAGMAIAFEPLKLPLKAYVCMVMAFVIGSVFQAVTNEFWLWFGLVAGAVIVHWLMEVIYHFDFHAIFKHTPTLLVVIAATVALAIGLQKDVFGYDTWLPDESDIEWVEAYNIGVSREDYGYVNSNRYWRFERDERLSDPEVIAAMRQLAARGAENAARMAEERDGIYENESYDYYDLTVRYSLSGGKETGRRYKIPITDETQALMEDVIYSEEYLRCHSGAFVFETRWEKYDEIELAAEIVDLLRGESVIKTLRGGEQVRELVRALQADVLDFTPEQADQEGAVLRIELGGIREWTAAFDYYDTVAVYPSYTRTLALLEAAGVTVEPLRADEIQCISLYDWRSREGDDMEGRNDITVSDPEKIEVLMKNLVVGDSGDRFGPMVNNRIFADIQFRDGSFIQMKYLCDKIPEELLTELFGAPFAE